MHSFKKLLLICLIPVVAPFFFGCNEATAASVKEDQPALNETRHLERSLEMFSKKIVSKNKVVNMQYKRHGKQAVLSFDIIKPNEVMFMLYLLEYSDGDWRIAREYNYVKGIAPISACA